jgi:hypothetical protein
MIEMLENFLSANLPIVGLVAYSIQLPDRVLATECFSKSLYPSATEQMLNTVVQTGRSFLSTEGTAAQYCWVFECFRVYVAARADGACLALLVENNPTIQMARIQETLQGFVEVTEG